MIYLDHASTSYKKPLQVSNSIHQLLTHGFGNPGRGANEVSMASARILQEGRHAVCRLFHGPSPEHVIFKGSLTDALNTLLIGLLKKGDHVISSVMDHNSVLRPLENLKNHHMIEYDLLPCDQTGKVLMDNIKNLEKTNTRAVILSHVSNLTGTIQSISKIRSLLKNKDIFIIIDTAQSAGFLDINYEELNVDGLAFTGHKGLLGPPGIGGFVLNDRLSEALDPVFTGGTGSESLSLTQPNFLPDKFEAGTPNIIGILGLTKGIEYLENTCSFKKSNLTHLTKTFIQNVLLLDHITLVGSTHHEDRVPTFSLIFSDLDPSEAAYILENTYGIITRSGYHCAPLSHRALGTLKSGSLRISFGHFTTIEEVNQLLQALKRINEV